MNKLPHKVTGGINAFPKILLQVVLLQSSNAVSVTNPKSPRHNDLPHERQWFINVNAALLIAEN